MGSQLFSGCSQLVPDILKTFSDVIKMCLDVQMKLRVECFKCWVRPHWRKSGKNKYRKSLTLTFLSNRTKLSMMGSQLFSGWCQMFLDILRCFQMFSVCSQLVTDILMTFSDVFKSSWKQPGGVENTRKTCLCIRFRNKGWKRTTWSWSVQDVFRCSDEIENWVL